MSASIKEITMLRESFGEAVHSLLSANRLATPVGFAEPDPQALRRWQIRSVLVAIAAAMLISLAMA